MLIEDSMSERNDAEWTVLDRKILLKKRPWLEVAEQRVRLPDGKVVDDYLDIGLPDFVVVFPETTEGDVVMLRQYKHGIGRTSLTLPGGHIDPGEAPADAARRELLEETGYAAGGLAALGCFFVNGNYGCGLAHFFRATDCRPERRPNPGDLEDMQIEVLDLDRVRQALFNGEIGSLPHAAGVSLAMTLRAI